MELPLYRLNSEYLRERKTLINESKGNNGLIFNKYFSFWNTDRNGINWCVESGDKTKWIATICNQPVGNRTLLSEASERLINLTDFMTGKFCCYRTTWRFVTGLGLNHPIENGMAWHHTLGVPYLPGSSLKGLVRCWVEQWLDDTSWDDIVRIFGHRKSNDEGDKKDQQGVGSVIFHDALPVEPVQLAPDVMTPHYQDYYSKDKTPGDWMDPNPIPFLTVAENQVFLFAISPRERGLEQSQSDLETVLQWLDQALVNIGAGAKTAAGYGRFGRCEQAEERLASDLFKRKEVKAKQVSSIPAHLTGPIAERMLKEKYDDNPDEFLNILKTKWLLKMQSGETSTTEKKIIANLLKNWYQVYRKSQWEKPNQKNTPAIKAIREVLEQNPL